jgi:hypothetical protein
MFEIGLSVGAMGISIVAAMAFNKLIERPAQAWSARMSYRGSEGKRRRLSATAISQQLDRFGPTLTVTIGAHKELGDTLTPALSPGGRRSNASE